jgi:hypothetical protein
VRYIALLFARGRLLGQKAHRLPLFLAACAVFFLRLDSAFMVDWPGGSGKSSRSPLEKTTDAAAYQQINTNNPCYLC